MLSHYLYNVSRRTVVAFMEGKDKDSDVTVVKSEAVLLGRENQLYEKVMSREEARAYYKRLRGDGFETLQHFIENGEEWYGIPCRTPHTNLFRTGIAKLKDVERAKEKFFRDYHPAGYGSYVQVFVHGLNDNVFYIAQRAASCD